jgi:CRISPR system Cascade subunit CasE
MFISQVQLRSDAQDRRQYWRLIQESYQFHALVWDLFGEDPGQTRDFLYRVDSTKKLPTFLVVSSREPVNRFDVWDITTKDYKPRLFIGQRLSFVLRANPVRKKRDDQKKQHRHDVVMEVKSRLQQEGKPRAQWPGVVDIVQNAGFVWLASRSESCGFQVREHEVVSDGYMQNRFRKPDGNHDVRFSTIEFTGLLTVTNPDLLISTLYSGIGPEKGFGCGLMLVKPAGDDSYAP